MPATLPAPHDVAELLAQLDTTIARQNSPVSERLGSTGHREFPIPFDQRASDARVVLIRTLRRAAAHCLVDRPIGFRRILGLHAPRSAHPVDCARYLVLRDKLGDRRASASAEFVEDAVQRATIAIDKTASTSAGVKLRRDPATVYGTAADLERITAVLGQPVRAGTIREWRRRGRLAPTVTGGQIYRLSDVLNLADGAALIQNAA